MVFLAEMKKSESAGRKLLPDKVRGVNSKVMTGNSW